MDALTEPGREFWRGVLTAGGCTAIPRWTLDPVPGVAEHEVPIPRESLSAARRVAYELAAPLRSVLWPRTRGARRAVRRARRGDRVRRGRRSSGRCPASLTTEPVSWRALVEKTRRAESVLRAYAGFPVDDLQRELGLTGPSFETVFDPTGAGARPARDGARAARRLSERATGSSLRLRYRTDVLDAECAARIAGYHLTALALIAADPDAEHRAAEPAVRRGDSGSSSRGSPGPRRELPDRRVHELFERAGADAPGRRRGRARRAGSGPTGELNARANRLGRALLARGLRREGVVAVVTERNLDWMAAVLAIFKAGGCVPAARAALPGRPHRRPRCPAPSAAFVLTEPGSTDHARPGARQAARDPAAARRRRPTPRVTPTATSASPVAPGPARLHPVHLRLDRRAEGRDVRARGMLNHIFAKLDDLAIAEGEVVPQTGPQCFDISRLAAGRRARWSAAGPCSSSRRRSWTSSGSSTRSSTAGPPCCRSCRPTSRCADLPGAAPPDAAGPAHACRPPASSLKKELVQRWFAAQPGITLVNTYGLTETSDDAVHEVMDRRARRRAHAARPPDQQRPRRTSSTST